MSSFIRLIKITKKKAIYQNSSSGKWLSLKKSLIVPKLYNTYNVVMEKDKKIATELISMMKKDQAMRKKWAESGFDSNKYDSKVDETNEKRIKEITDKTGWPAISAVGKEASTAAWLLVQHAGNNPSFQKTILQKMKKLPKKEVDQKQIAKLEDRIRLLEGKKQLYGTSFNINLKTKKLTVGPIYDIKNIDKRRKKLGLDSFEAHKKRAIESYQKFQKE